MKKPGSLICLKEIERSCWVRQDYWWTISSMQVRRNWDRPFLLSLVYRVWFVDWQWTWHWACRVCPDHTQWPRTLANNWHLPCWCTCVWQQASISRHTRESTDSYTFTYRISSNLFKIHACSDVGRGLWLWPLCGDICSCYPLPLWGTENVAPLVEMLWEQKNFPITSYDEPKNWL